MIFCFLSSSKLVCRPEDSAEAVDVYNQDHCLEQFNHFHEVMSNGVFGEYGERLNKMSKIDLRRVCLQGSVL